MQQQVLSLLVHPLPLMPLQMLPKTLLPKPPTWLKTQLAKPLTQ